MEYWKNISGIIQALTTSIAIVIGGVWTYLIFVRQRLNFPKVVIELITENHILPDGNRLVHAEVAINNVGNILLRSNYAELRIRQVLPVHDVIKTTIDDGKNPVMEDGTKIEWPMLCGREWKWEKGDFEIEPGESDSLHTDYIIPDNVEVVEFYCYISNFKKKRSKLGWTLTQIHKFHTERKTMTDKTQNKVKNNQQQRQQKQQRQQEQQKPQKPVKPKKKK